MELNEQSQERLRKRRELEAEGTATYAYRFDPTHRSSQVLDEFKDLGEGAESEKSVTVAGRLLSIRGHGKTAFAHLSDQDGRIQIYVKKDILGEEAFKGLFKRLDLGDIIGVEGPVFRTKTGELTVQVRGLTLLTKALMNPPEKFHGLKDVELRYRHRYLDLQANPEVRDTFVKRAKAVAAIRHFLEAKGFLEAETPILQPVAGGAAARPFVTHHNTLDMDLYLRIAPELYLKRLLVGGMERVFEIARNFRNEGISIKHNPEFTMVEVYQAYADGDAMMTLTEQLIASVANEVCGGDKVEYQGQTLDFRAPWKRLGMAQAVREIGGVDPDKLDDAAVDKILADLPPARRRALKGGALLEEVFGALVEPKLIQPTFITDYPLDISPLAKKKEGSEELADRFELFIFGREMANGFSELNDPLDQYERFKAQLEKKAQGDDEAHAMDEDFVKALMHGMPPAGGMGLGIDRLIMLLTDAASIRDVILFPQLRGLSHGLLGATDEETEG